jgi:salicylate hydroxylase
MVVKSSIWAGPDIHAVVYFLRGGGLLDFVACVELDEWIEESCSLKRPWREQ